MKGLLLEMERYGRQQEVPLIRQSEISLLCHIVKQYKPKHILEIGTGIGYSTLLMLLYAAPDAIIDTIEINTERMEKAHFFISRTPYEKQVRFHTGDAFTVLKTLHERWDFVFLDGPKGQYIRQLQLILPYLQKQALIVADNVRYHDMLYIDGTIPHKHRTAVQRIRTFLSYIENETLFSTVFFENGDGMTVSRYKGYHYE